nr:hypothetical protein [uncultured archaeon]
METTARPSPESQAATGLFRRALLRDQSTHAEPRGRRPDMEQPLSSPR